MSTENQTIRQETTRGVISLDRLYKADYQKEGTMTAQIRQVVTVKSMYPTQKVSSTLQNNIFSQEEFGIENKEYTSEETRVAWIPVPSNATESQIKEKLDAAYAKGACIYKVLSNKPILDENQQYAVNNPDIEATMDTFANSQVVRYPVGHEKAGQIIKDNHGKVQYRRTFFWNCPMEDQDVRTLDSADTYLSPEIAAELQGSSIMQGQTL